MKLTVRINVKAIVSSSELVGGEWQLKRLLHDDRVRLLDIDIHFRVVELVRRTIGHDFLYVSTWMQYKGYELQRTRRESSGRQHVDSIGHAPGKYGSTVQHNSKISHCFYLYIASKVRCAMFLVVYWWDHEPRLFWVEHFIHIKIWHRHQVVCANYSSTFHWRTT